MAKRKTMPRPSEKTIAALEELWNHLHREVQIAEAVCDYCDEHGCALGYDEEARHTLSVERSAAVDVVLRFAGVGGH